LGLVIFNDRRVFVRHSSDDGRVGLHRVALPEFPDRIGGRVSSHTTGAVRWRTTEQAQEISPI